ncbi:UNVERIFIED_CONTAM: hypothetical protein GTU68_066516 [Idotea baltica]|nr:hypothetical protein [Idotea baltica]
MDLITPAFGLIFWQTIIFLIVLFILGRFAWKPILGALQTREDSIDEALKSAEKAKEEMASLKADNEKLLVEAKLERDKMLKAATKIAQEIKDQAKEDALLIGDKMIEDAKSSIESEKNNALKQIKDQVAELSLQITEKLLKKNLSSDKSQQELIQSYIKEINLN